MSGSDNLIGKGFDSRSAEEARECGRIGGIKSGQARREKRDLKKRLEYFLEETYSDENGNSMTGADIVCKRLVQRASQGNVNAFLALRDTIGQKPVEKVMIAEVDPSVIDEVERMVNGDDT